jgi:predicted mannosyl-3-phosphoglycerate phosphatase (HAD superfamily)
MSRSEKGERGWNSKPTFFKVKSRVSRTGVVRKLEDVRRDLAPLEEQGKVEGFFNNVVNADKLSGLVEDVRDAMMEYQVCIYSLSVPGTTDVRTRLRYSKISIIRVVVSW